MAAGANGPMKYVGLTKFKVLYQRPYHEFTRYDLHPAMLTSGCASPISLMAFSAKAFEAQ